MNGDEMRVLHTTASVHERHGGPPRTIGALCEGLARRGMAVTLVTQWEDGENLVPPPELVDTVFAGARSATSALAFGRQLRRTVRARRVRLVHDHGVWLPTNAAAAWAARRAGVPLVVTPRGMLEPWALGFNAPKKKLAWAAFQRRALQGAALLHATSEAEYENLRALGLTAPVAVIPNGVHFPPPAPAPARGARQDRHALFLSRIHPKKGLLDLVRAWAIVRPAGWTLTIAGPDELGHSAEVRALAAELGLSGAITVQGPTPDAEKWALYGGADLFVLPTYSEYFGVVVAEALAAGVPAITTHGAPWRVLETERCGWWTPTGVEPLAAALREATALPPDTLAAMGARGRRYAAEHLSWDGVAEDMAAAYRWVLAPDTEPPACLRLD